MILGSNPKNRRLVYIDGFAGPGGYTNAEKGSPIIALEVAKAVAYRPGATKPATEYSFLFVEKKPDFAASLR